MKKIIKSPSIFRPEALKEVERKVKEAYQRSVSLLEDKIDNAQSDKSKLQWLERYFMVAVMGDQKEEYKELYNRLKND